MTQGVQSEDSILLATDWFGNGHIIRMGPVVFFHKLSLTGFGKDAFS